MKPTVSRLEAEYAGRVEFKSVDIDIADNTPLKRQLHFIGQPQFVITGAKSQILSSRNGYQQYTTLKQDIEAALSAP